MLGHRHRVEHLTRCRALLGTTESPAIADDTDRPRDYRDRDEGLTGRSLRVCSRCQHGHMRVVEDLVAGRPATAGWDTS